MQMKSCVVLGGGIWQEFLVRFLKEKGYFVHVVNPLVTPTVKLGDHHLQLDIRHADAIGEALLQDGYRPSFVVSDQSDVAVMPVAQLAKKLGLPGNPTEAITLFTDKNRMYEYADSLGIPVLPHAPVRESRDVSEFLKRCGFPIVLKPSDSTNSRGLSIVCAAADVEVAYRHAMENSNTHTAVVQKFCPAPLQLTVEGVASGGCHKTLCFSYKDEFLAPGFSRSIRWPFKSPLVGQVREYNDQFVSGSGLRFGITHGEYMIEGRQIWFNEIAARGGGYRISSDIVPWVTGVNVMEILYLSLLGQSVNLDALEVKDKAAIIRFYRNSELKTDIDNAQVGGIEGLLEFRSDYIQHLYAKDESNPRDCFAILIAKDFVSLDRRIQRLEQLICSRPC
jgi:formate-dependent phosphoribosylglycinamide formyltransferase (GAR transformylase)